MSGELDSYDERVVEAFRANGGVADPGIDLLLLHHVGARSGRERVTPLAYWRVDDTSVAVLASNRGAPKHPGWYHNLVANPDAKTEIGTQTFAARARVATANERSKLLRRITEQTPSVSAALSRTAREIPLVILDLRTDDVRLAASQVKPAPVSEERLMSSAVEACRGVLEM
jgi:deazaflavin-dependent oxidoreductase (nitroreductase family)